jgi:hypothetical protein
MSHTQTLIRMSACALVTLTVALPAYGQTGGKKLGQNGNMQNRMSQANGLQNLTPQQIAQLQTLMQQMQAILQQGANGQQNFQQRGNQNFNGFQQQGNAAIPGNGNAPAAGFRPTGLQRK